MAYTEDKKPGELTALTSLATDDVFVVGDTSDASEVAKKITYANLVTDLADETQTFTNKTINGDNNTISNLVIGDEVTGASTALTDTADITYNADTDVSANGWVVDEDNMASNLATKVPTQQSVKAYVDAQIGGGGVTDGDKGDITVSSSGTVWTVDNDAITFDKIENIATNRILGRSTAGTGSIEALADASARTIMGLATSDSPQFAGINVGHATDTTITRVSAGVIAVEGTNVSLAGHTHSLSNITDVTATATELNVLDGIPATLTATELGYVDGVTSAIQTQLDAKLASSAYDDATAAETNTGTSTTKYVSPDGLAGSYAGTKPVGLAIVESDTAVAVADGKVAIPIPPSLNGMNLVTATATVHTQGVTGTTDIQLRRRRSGTDVDMLSTKITIGAEYHASDGVINTSNDDVATGDQIYVDVDAIHSGTAPNGLSVVLEFRLP